jgi:hypothetical protein
MLIRYLAMPFSVRVHTELINAHTTKMIKTPTALSFALAVVLVTPLRKIRPFMPPMTRHAFNGFPAPARVECRLAHGFRTLSINTAGDFQVPTEADCKSRVCGYTHNQERENRQCHDAARLFHVASSLFE